jgi:hypothetical protein
MSIRLKTKGYRSPDERKRKKGLKNEHGRMQITPSSVIFQGKSAVGVRKLGEKKRGSMVDNQTPMRPEKDEQRWSKATNFEKVKGKRNEPVQFG